MAKKPQQEVALQKSNEVEVLTDRPDWLKGTMRGNENVGLEDLVLPRIELVQPLSPCKDKHEAAFIPGIEDGNLFNTVSRSNYGDTVRFVPVFYRRVFLLFKTRKAGGGFRGSFDSAELAEAARLRQDDGPSNYEVVDCGEHIVMIIGTGGKPEQAILAMTKTKHKPSKQLNSLVRMRGEDRWACVYELGSVRQQNDKGTFYNFTVKPMGFATKEIFMEGEKLHSMLTSGGRTLKANYDDTDIAGEVDNSEM